jgi:hypothetical protein
VKRLASYNETARQLIPPNVARPQPKGAAVSQPPNTRSENPFKNFETNKWAVRKPPPRQFAKIVAAMHDPDLRNRLGARASGRQGARFTTLRT